MSQSEATPCEGCENQKPELLQENEIALELLIHTATQWRVGMNGAYGYDLLAIYSTAEILGIEMTPALLDKIQDVEQLMLKKFEKERGNER